MQKNNRQTKLDADIDFVMTQDGSTGLYNNAVGDIYHSTYGALNEAVEKFIRPLNFATNFSEKNHLKVLDICYGIGYNTKAFLHEILKSGYSGQINIDILEYDKKLVSISPFIKDGFYSPAVDYILLSCLKGVILHENVLIDCLFSDKKYNSFLREDIKALLKRNQFFRCVFNQRSRLDSFLHNIYYQCISKRQKRRLKPAEISKFVMRPFFDDARISVQRLEGDYDIIFLDAFTPAKLPTLWSVQFFKALYGLMNDNSMLLTYSNSAAVRNAMIKAGFYIGKILDKKQKSSGTVASKNGSYIQLPLSEDEKGLLNTSAGVCFEDDGLNLPPDTIIKRRLDKIKELNLESSSHYLKNRKAAKCMM